MTPEAYVAMQARVEVLARFLLDIDPAELEAFVQMGEHADSIAPFIDPTAWTRGREQLRMVVDHARAIATARRSIEDATPATILAKRATR